MYELPMDYSKRIEDYVLLGHYGDVDPHVTTAQFPLEERCGRRFVTLHLLIPKHDMLPLEIDEILATEKIRKGTARELLALGATYPELQKKMNVVALGATLDSNGYRYALELAFINGMRKVCFTWPHERPGTWDAGVAFIGVQED
jgi:hypothetical protein